VFLRYGEKKWNKITKVPQSQLLVSIAGLKPNPPKHHTIVSSPSVRPANVNVLDMHVYIIKLHVIHYS